MFQPTIQAANSPKVEQTYENPDPFEGYLAQSSAYIYAVIKHKAPAKRKDMIMAGPVSLTAKPVRAKIPAPIVLLIP